VGCHALTRAARSEGSSRGPAGSMVTPVVCDVSMTMLPPVGVKGVSSGVNWTVTPLMVGVGVDGYRQRDGHWVRASLVPQGV